MGRRIPVPRVSGRVSRKATIAVLEHQKLDATGPRQWESLRISRLVAGQWPPPPVHADVREHPVLDLVPLAGRRWQTVISRPVSRANRASSTFQSRER